MNMEEKNMANSKHVKELPVKIEGEVWEKALDDAFKIKVKEFLCL